VASMREALEACRGEHDFAAFQSTGTPVRDTVRTMLAVGLTEDPAPLGSGAALEFDTPREPAAPLLVIELTGTGFLRHMVRAIAGTLVEIGRGRWPAEGMGDILASRDRSRAGPTAPPQGLFLIRVDY
jgi:tRNA pseudouridine38-40 synthase